MNWSDKYEVLWHTPPRVATRSCGSVMRYLNFVCDGDGYLPNHLSKIPEGKENYYYILNVRNPYSRFFSLYRISLFHTQVYDLTFESWVLDLLNFRIKFNPYDAVISETLKKVPNQILKLENIIEDINSLFFIDKNDSNLVDIIKSNIEYNLYDTEFESKFKTKFWKEYYNQKIADQVYSMCEKDFINFGYDKNSWK